MGSGRKGVKPDSLDLEAKDVHESGLTPFQVRPDPIFKRPLNEVLISVSQSNTSSREERAIIKSATAEDMHRVLLNTTGEELRRIIKTGLEHANTQTLSALKKINEDGLSINKLRTDRYFNPKKA